MKMTRKITAIISAAAIMLTAVPAFAGYEPIVSENGYTLGKYTSEIDQAARQKIEEMYNNRPVLSRPATVLGLGLTAVPAEDGVLISWRFVSDSRYNLYRGDVKLNDEPLAATNYFDELGKPGTEYTLVAVADGEEIPLSRTTVAWDKEYIEFPLVHRDGYIIDDGGTGDLDGDGKYEYLFRRTPIDMAPSTRTLYPIIEAYDDDGTFMWEINIGPNEINEHDINFAVYDFNLDGKDEVIMRSFEGTIDGTGEEIGDTNGDKITDYSKDEENLAIFQDRQYVVSTPEFMSMYDGETGAEIARTDLLPEREPLESWSYRYSDTGRLTKRASHYLWGVAYLDGERPSIVNVRGAWDNVKIAAWHVEDNEFVTDWVADTPNTDDLDSIWGAVNHNMGVADIDFDGKDEIFSGPMAVDDDGTTLYATKAEYADGKETKLLHGDAFDMAIMSPDYHGYLAWACHETSALPANIELHDGLTGQVLWGYGKSKDTGRSRAADIDPNYRGFEVWGSTWTVPANISGEEIADSWNEFKVQLPDGSYEKDEEGNDALVSLPMNYKIYWDGDLLSEFLDGIRISKYDYDNKEIDVIFDAEGCASNSGTKAVPCIQADLFGDWREEVVWKTADEQGVRIYSTNIETPYRIPPLMWDSAYRAAIATQNNHYNQPPNLSYYLGAETTEVPVPEVLVTVSGEEVPHPALNGSHATYSITTEDSAMPAAKSIKLFVGSPNAYVDNDIVKIDPNDANVTPIIIDDRTLVPVRFIAESFGMKASWDDATRKITLSGRGNTVEMTADSPDYTVNGEAKTLDVPAQIINDRTLIPLRAMAESIGRTVYWNDGLIVISKKEFADTDAIGTIVTALKTGEKPVVTPPPATPTPEPTPNPLDSMTATDYTDEDGNEWKMYINEDFSSYDIGSNGGFEGTKPAPLDNIAVAEDSGRKVMSISGSSKGNRNALYRTGAPLTGKTLIELDWKSGLTTGGKSSGELRFADASNNVFLAFSVQDGREMRYSCGGKISGGGLETAPWEMVDASFTTDTWYHIKIVADFDTKTLSFTVSDGKKTAEINDMEFSEAANFEAIEVLAVRDEQNFEWATSLADITAGIAK